MSQGCVEPPEAERGKIGSSRGIVALLTPRFWVSGLQNCVKINSSCFMSLPSPHWQSFVMAAPGLRSPSTLRQWALGVTCRRAHLSSSGSSLRSNVEWHVGSQFPDQASNPCPLHWKSGVLTAGQSGKFQERASRCQGADQECSQSVVGDGNSLAVQWLRLHELSLPRAWVQSLVGELRSCKLPSVAKKKKKNLECGTGGG